MSIEGGSVQEKLRWFTTRERWEKHPIVLLTKEYGNLTFNDLWEILRANNDWGNLNNKFQKEMTQAEKRRVWLEIKIKEMGWPRKLICYKDTGQLNQNLIRLRSKKLIIRNPETRKEKREGLYEYVQSKDRKGEDLLPDMMEPTIIAKLTKREKLKVTFQERTRKDQPKVVKVWTPDSWVHDKSLKSLPKKMSKYPTLITSDGKVTALDSLFGVDSFCSLTSLSHDLSQTNEILFRKITSDYIQQLYDFFAPQLIDKVLYALMQEDADEKTKKELKLALINGQYTMWLSSTGWQITLLHQDHQYNEIKELAQRILDRIKTPVVITSLSPIPHISPEGFVKCGWIEK